EVDEPIQARGGSLTGIEAHQRRGAGRGRHREQVPVLGSREAAEPEGDALPGPHLQREPGLDAALGAGRLELAGALARPLQEEELAGEVLLVDAEGADGAVVADGRLLVAREKRLLVVVHEAGDAALIADRAHEARRLLELRIDGARPVEGELAPARGPGGVGDDQLVGELEALALEA